jgi:hypothetical protein
MSTNSLFYLGFVDGASHHTWNMDSSTWVIYSPEGKPVSSVCVCLEPSTNNVAKYRFVI